jgi:DNA repair protein RecN (Recombination protein N)
MLARLRIRDLVLIDELDLELSPGFNALTGETGAGKSLVVAALDLLLGRRGSSGLVRQGAEEAEVEGVFDVNDEPAVRERLAAGGLPADGELLVRRVIPAEGRHRCHVNGKLASLAVLADLADGLASVMGQHEHHQLLEPARQLELLDGYGGHGPLLEEMRAAHAASRAAREEHEALLARERDRAARLDFLDFQLAELDEIDPRPGELEELEAELSLLRHRAEILAAVAGGADELYDRDGSVFERLGTVERSLVEAARHDPRLAGEGAKLAEAAALVEDVVRGLSGYGSGPDADPERLAELDERREALRRLTRKHRVDLAGVIALRGALAAERETLARFEEALATAASDLEARRAAAAALASKLRAARGGSAKRLARAVTRELRDLSFGGAAFEVGLEQVAGEPGSLGADRAEFLAALNPGEGRHPLRKVASGGELSRLMLAIRRVLAGVGPVGTYVFDEVDAGIGGAVAAAVGRKLREVAAHHQVICITHLPQISALADAHFVVTKAARKGRTVTRVARLDPEQRIEELARMLGDGRVTAALRDAARELLATPSR